MEIKAASIKIMDEKKPKYLEIAQWIKGKIDIGELVPGHKMYSENELSQMLGYSRQTIRHAIDVLDSEGIVKRMQGSGTYVCENRPYSNGSRRIALITTYVDSYIFPRTIKTIEQICFERGYSVIISFTNNQMEKEQSVLEDILLKEEVAGIIMEPTKSALPNMNKNLFKQIQKLKIPLLFINSYYPWLNAPHITMNDRMAGKKATEYLLGKGHKKIGGIFKADDGQGHLRFQGYCEAMKHAGLPFDTRNTIWIDTDDVYHLKNCLDRIIDRLSGCTAFVCFNDEVAYGLVPLFSQKGIHIPEDMSMVSIDDSDLAVMGDLKFTSIPHPMELLGEKAALNMLGMIESSGFNGNYDFNVEIVERDSVLTIDD